MLVSSRRRYLTQKLTSCHSLATLCGITQRTWGTMFYVTLHGRCGSCVPGKSDASPLTYSRPRNIPFNLCYCTPPPSHLRSRLRLSLSSYFRPFHTSLAVATMDSDNEESYTGSDSASESSYSDAIVIPKPKRAKHRNTSCPGLKKVKHKQAQANHAQAHYDQANHAQADPTTPPVSAPVPQTQLSSENNPKKASAAVRERVTLKQEEHASKVLATMSSLLPT